jgi:hypothetical protein
VELGLMDYDLEDRLGAAEDLAPISQGGSGQMVTITTPFVGVFDPATDTTSAGAATTQIGSGVEVAYSANSVDGTLIRTGDKQFLLSALTFGADGVVTETPLTAPVAHRDTLTFGDGAVWAIKRVDPLSPAGRPIIYTLQLRSGA